MTTAKKWVPLSSTHPSASTATATRTNGRREYQECWSPATYVDLSLMPVHREEAGDFPEQIGVMARRNHQRTVVYLHLLGIKIRGSFPGRTTTSTTHCT